MSAARLLLVAILAVSAGAQQSPPPGQPPAKDMAITYRNIEKDAQLGWLFAKPANENQVGVWDPNGPNSPGGILPTTLGLLEFTMPTGQFWTIGIEITQFLYDDSTAAEFADFGPLDSPVLLPAPDYPLDYPVGAKMWQHLSDQTMWAFNAGPPSNWMSWLTTFPPIYGPGPSVTLQPLGGPGNFFMQIMAALPSVAVPPPSSPGGGGLIGMNVILQLAVAENDPLPPAPTRYLMSNAWGLQAMAAPVLKINAGNGGNFGPAGQTRELKAAYPNVGVRVQLDTLGGAHQDVPTFLFDGSRIRYVPTPSVKTGPLTVTSPSGQVDYDRPLVHVVTHGTPVDIAVDAPTPVVRSIDGDPVFGMSFYGTATNAPTVINFPDIPTGVAFDLEAKFYPLDRSTNVAGFGDGTAANASIPIEIGVSPEGTVPTAGQIPAAAIPIGNGATVRVRKFENLVGGQDVAIKSSALVSQFDYLVVLRAYAAGTVSVTP